MFGRINEMEKVTKVQYGLMFTFGALTIGSALAPLGDTIRIAAVALLFGVTVGLWVSHLIQVLYDASSGDNNV